MGKYADNMFSFGLVILAFLGALLSVNYMFINYNQSAFIMSFGVTLLCIVLVAFFDKFQREYYQSKK